jgi:arylsulfatase A-like enzyme
MTPALLWAAVRKRQGAPACRLSWTWDLAGAILATLLLLGPLQTVQGFHPVAPIVVALGAGVNLRGWLVWKSHTWQRAAYWAGSATIALLPVYSLWQWKREAGAAGQVWSVPPPEGPNVIWIVLDTLRADHTSIHGYYRQTTPELEKWSKLGLTFEMARAPACWTLPSHVSMFTGLWPEEHGARVDRPYAGTSPTLAEHLRERGYATAGFVANVRMCNRAYGVGRGFDTYVDYPWNEEVSFKAAVANSALGSFITELARRLQLPVPEHYPFNYRRQGSAISTDGLRWLDDVERRNHNGPQIAERPYFLFLNFFDVHGPYLPSEGEARAFWKGPIPPECDAMPRCGWDSLHAYQNAAPGDRQARHDEFESVCRRLSDLYDECILEMDAEVGRFLGDLRDRGSLSNTWVVITSDHGEHFGEHSQFGHGSSLYNEATHVPLVVIPPLGRATSTHGPTGPLRGTRIKSPVSTRDLARTLAELTGPGMTNPFPGCSLACRWTEPEPLPVRPVFSQLVEPRLRGDDFRTDDVTRIESVISENRVLIDSDREVLELYHLSGDPRQERNLVNEAAEQARLERLKQTLNELRSHLKLPCD